MPEVTALDARVNEKGCSRDSEELFAIPLSAEATIRNPRRQRLDGEQVRLGVPASLRGLRSRRRLSGPARGQKTAEIIDKESRLIDGLAATLQLRKDPDPRRAAAGPLYVGFACECETWPAEGIRNAARSLLEAVAGLTPGALFGGVFRAPIFNQAAYEIHDGANLQGEPKEFYDRISFDMQLDHYSTKARRLYPITLLGPKLASQLSAADAVAAGALAVKEINGSLLIDAYPIVVETWDPEYLKATVELRRWLWPHTIQNPADAVGLGLKLPRR
jgi:hypothetical protein